MLEDRSAYKSITLTYNNLGMFYKQINKLSQATQFFKQILEIEEAVKADMEDSDNIDEAALDEIKREVASSLINLGSVYSSMKKHEISLNNLLRSNKLLEEVFNG